jgi:5-oxoprolinase (ATP-hydrolysing) subunit A
MSRTIDLNADLGEGFPWDQPLLDRVTSASVCCGSHAGDPETILQTLRWARERGVVVGAHPGYSDRKGFGRRGYDVVFPKVPGKEVKVYNRIERVIRIQVRKLAALAKEARVKIRFLKPHGALYNEGQVDGSIAFGIAGAATFCELPVLGLPGSELELWTRRCRSTNRFIREGFADRRYLPDGRLVPRSEPDAILQDPDEIRAQALSLVDRGIDTICIHGDNPRSVELADLVLATLKDAGIEPRSFL